MCGVLTPLPPSFFNGEESASEYVLNNLSVKNSPSQRKDRTGPVKTGTWHFLQIKADVNAETSALIPCLTYVDGVLNSFSRLGWPCTVLHSDQWFITVLVRIMKKKGIISSLATSQLQGFQLRSSMWVYSVSSGFLPTARKDASKWIGKNKMPLGLFIQDVFTAHHQDRIWIHRDSVQHKTASDCFCNISNGTF